MHRTRFASLALLGLMTGCAGLLPTVRHEEGVPAGYSGPTATLSDSGVRATPFEAHLYSAEAIDGRDIVNAIASTRASYSSRYGPGEPLEVVLPSRKVPAGTRVVVSVHGRRKSQISSRASHDSRMVTGTLEFIPEPDGAYAVDGELGTVTSSIWIEDRKTGKRVTETVTRTRRNMAGVASREDDTWCNRHIAECSNAKVLPEASAEKPIRGWMLTCGAPHALERDCSYWHGATRVITLEERVVMIAGSRDGRRVFVMPPTFEVAYLNHFANVRYLSVKRWLGERGVRVTRVRAVVLTDSIAGYFMELDRDGYSLLAALPSDGF
jgi:hypothetical protein